MKDRAHRLSRAFPGVLMIVVQSFGAGVLAVEVTVQNDNNIPGATVPNFIPGDHVSVWLTSPCDGDVVAVQVYWDSQLGANPPSQETSISVLGSGAFPTPGAVLQNQGAVPAVVVAPILTDGLYNEFRHLDQAMTTPLSVPVTNGQTFVVDLEIFNQSSGNPLASSVVPDTDGCQAGLNAVFTNPPGTYLDACLLGVTGDWLIRAVVDCRTDPIPTVSEWGLLVMTLLGMAAGTVMFRGFKHRLA